MMLSINKFAVFCAILIFSNMLYAQSWQLVWQDEFLGNQIDFNKWEHEVNGTGGGNNELQYYTDRDVNSFVQGGNLIIRAHKETFSGNDGTRQYTSARMRTLNKGDWKYGRVDVRAKIPAGIGTWPAIWMLPSDWVYGGWPKSGEIDIMEHVGWDPKVIHGTVHTEAYNHLNGTQRGDLVVIDDFDTNFHLYSLEWTPTQIRMYVDNNLYFTFDNENQGYTKWPFDQRFHLILNIAIGGSWGGVQGVDDSIFPVDLTIDYVRVYQDANAAPVVNVTSPIDGSIFQPGDNIEINVDATDSDGTIQKVEFFQDAAKIGEDNQAPFTWTVENGYSGCYEIITKTTDNDGYVTSTNPISITVGSDCGQAPYRIAPEAIPGIIEMENYDLGGPGVGYLDNTTQNSGNSYRNDGVDIEATSDVGAGYSVGWLENDEWMDYTVNVRNTGTYSIISRVASENGGGKFVLEMNGTAVTPEIDVNATGGWQDWQSIFTENVMLQRGVNVLRFRVINGGFNINKMTIFAISVGVEDDIKNGLPTAFQLQQNYPNPFNPSTTIRYSIPVNEVVNLTIFNELGQEVATLVNERQTVGNYEVTFDATHLNSGVYFAQLSTSTFKSVKKMLLIK